MKALIVLPFLVALASPATALRTSEPTDNLLSALADPDPDIRALAADLLGDDVAEPGVVATLGRTLANSDEAWRVRAAAADSLGRLAGHGSPSAPEHLLVAMERDDDWRVRAAAIEAAWSIDEGTTLRRMLAERAAPLTIDTGRAVLTLGAAGVNATGLADADPRVRRIAAMAELLEARDTTPVRPELVAALDDSDPVVRERIARALVAAVPRGADASTCENFASAFRAAGHAARVIALPGACSVRVLSLPARLPISLPRLSAR